MYIDDLIAGGETVVKARHLKETAQTIFNEAHFELHKWHSNVASLEVEKTSSSEQNQTYAKEQLGVKKGETKMLGMNPPPSKLKEECCRRLLRSTIHLD